MPDPAHLFIELLHIAWFIVLPLLLTMSLGYVIQKGLGLDLVTLTRLNFYVVVPAMMYHALVSSAVDLKNVGVVVGFTLLSMAVWSGVTLLAAALRGVDPDQRRAMLMTTIFFNAGNYGLPLQDLAFRSVGLNAFAQSLQVFVMIVQNLTSFTIGIVIASGRWGKGQLRRNLLHIARFPPIYALAAAFITIGLRRELGGQGETLAMVLRPVWDMISIAANGFVVVALVTLGAQLAVVPRGVAHRYPVTLSVVLRLLVAPAIGLGLIWLLGIKGVVAQVLLISTATPTSVNCMLLCLEFRNHPDYVARAVFYSTILSPITVTLVVLLSRTGLVPGLGM